jgi:hypothetical protein
VNRAHVLISCALCYALTGRWRLLCAHAADRGWRRFMWAADWAFFCSRGEIGHCRNRLTEESSPST